MSIQQAAAPVTDKQLDNAQYRGFIKILEEELSWDKPGIGTRDRFKCRLYPKLSFFFDGTGNNLWQELEKPVEERALSNVAKLYQAAIDDKNGREAVRRYFPGVGTPYHYPYTNVYPNEDKGGRRGLGFGAGGEIRLKAALSEFRRLLEIDWSAGATRHMPWITLSVFGFSRGATLARVFVRRLIAEQCERAGSQLIWKSSWGDRVRLRIVFMGLFDTVASVGGPGLHMGWGAELAIPQEVERCVHYVSGHEVRQAFPLDSVRVGSAYPSNCTEVVYPGVHSDVGGGYFSGFQGRSNLLSRIPLRHMYCEALKSGVMLKRPQDLQAEILNEITLPDDAPLIGKFSAYMDRLPKSDSSLESLCQAHRIVKFKWRSAITRSRQDIKVLGALYRQVDPAMCAVVPAQNRHIQKCPDIGWTYELPRKPEDQVKQLLCEHRRLVREIPSIRNPTVREGDSINPRASTDYEKLIIKAWDDEEIFSDEIELFLADHVHDSVAHFTDWPCALHDARGIFCDKQKYFASIDQQPDSTVT